MGVITDIIRINSDDTLSFGDYTLPTKTKKENFEVSGNFYKAKSFKEVTKLKKDNVLVYESLPGTAVHHFKVESEKVKFMLEGYAPTQITLELEPQTTYELKIDKKVISEVQTTATGKVNFSVVATPEEQLIELNRLS
ncbi:MAG: endosialidase [Epulopiscium sp. Nele67-Bin005]|nr:MAG: endosialidase [Epulopiscium sp. Nele67-Bin005]